ncbi:Glycosyltransferase involved in cell wall bisynthesis [Saccharicrinis carchari]|uniref:Glycosyltransferase involved in cell wall bisynthesis n=1 Tax=Saccharicrinis carchari TaxID=1168039 RepID=A0A521EQ90_SACCC|nr:glycosyltransferase family 2 protein [Saccharicrinis carchari]SMO86094.1 Glycosyltransferase involved in cell wall bisynthesis [Saccharicrinis carchari]
MNLSIVVPLFNEEESLDELYNWVRGVLTPLNISFEVIFIDDGSNDTSWQVIEKLSAEHQAVKGIKFRRNYGKSAALYVGFEAAVGEVVITMDADLQDNPDELPELYRMVKEEGYDLVSGWKKKRHDPLGKTIPSKFFNWTARHISGINLHDFNCGLKAYRSEVVKSIEVYGEMHRYIPILAKRNGFSRIGEKVVVHRERQYGVSKFGIERFLKGFLDLLSLTFISKFGKRPMHLFGSLGTLMFAVGFFAALYLGIHKLYAVYHHINQALVTTSPYFYIALTSMIIGTQLFLAGFLAELVSRNNTERNKYQIEKKVNKQDDIL